MYKFDIQNYKWDIARQQINLYGHRDDHTCNLYEDTMILFGGYKSGTRVNDILSFKFEACKWTDLNYSGVPPCPRAGHTAVVLKNKLIVCAGTDNDNIRLNDVWIFNLLNN